MSAFLVSKAHLDQIVRLAYNETQDGEPTYGDPIPFDAARRTGSRDDLGQMLFDQNMASLRARYPDTKTVDDWEPDRAEVYVYAPTRRLLTVVEGLKALDCYDYQACESEGYDETDAAKFIASLRSHLIRRLPGYGEAKTWEYQE